MKFLENIATKKSFTEKKYLQNSAEILSKQISVTSCGKEGKGVMF